MPPDNVLFPSTKPPAFLFSLFFIPYRSYVRLTAGLRVKCCLGEKDLLGQWCSWQSPNMLNLVLPPLGPGTPNCSMIDMLAVEIPKSFWLKSSWRRALEEEDIFSLKFGKCWSFIFASPFLLPSLSSAYVVSYSDLYQRVFFSFSDFCCFRDRQ